MGNPGMREDQGNVTLRVKINGTWTDFGTWDNKSGGESKGKSVKHKPGNMGPEEDLGGPKSVSNVTLQRMRRLGDAAKIKQLHAVAGKADAMVSEQDLDADGNPYGDPTVYTGKLIEVNPASKNSSSSNVSMDELVIGPNETIG